MEAVVELSDLELNQALMLIAQVPIFDGTPEDLSNFIARIENILKLYPTQDERQNRILYLATDFRLSGEASQVNAMGEEKTWSELKGALSEAFEVKTRITKSFVDELEFRAYKIRSKLGLDNDENTTKDVIDQKLSDRYLRSLNQLDISTISILKKASQMRGYYEREVLREKHRDPNDLYRKQNNLCDLHRKQNSEKSPESPRVIRRGHKNLNKDKFPF
ncbi:uncharacterized protein LOC110188009 [Drosophila serrata]|uniref:uncharacterized protein LOC110188009 n=1 Tax=Drosophila serrata TaxID=7274 RepID=UPI000A1D2E2E|nr:uncharacterized protein LOC110188009 [Drosophila serrata]